MSADTLAEGRRASVGVEPTGSRAVPLSPTLVNQREAATLVGVSVTQVRFWDKRGLLKRALPQAGRSMPVMYEAGLVEEVAHFWSMTAWENEAAKMVGVSPRTLRSWGETGRVRVLAIGSRRVYLRDEIAREAERQGRLLSLRAIQREYGIAYEVLRPLIEDGTIPFENGGERKGAYLVDPRDLKPLLELKPCPVCGDPLSPGRKIHARCVMKTTEMRKFASNSLGGWWNSPAAEAFRSKMHELPCPNCGGKVTRRVCEVEGQRRARGQERVFCSQRCGAEYRWVKRQRDVMTLPGGRLKPGALKGLDPSLESFIRRHPSADVRKRYLGAIRGRDGMEAGMEAQFKPGNPGGGRRPSYTDQERAKVLELFLRGRSHRDIAMKVFGDARFKDKVSRIVRNSQ